MQIVYTYDQATGSLPTGMVAALDDIASYFDSLIANNIAVNIEVGYGEITQGGQSETIASGGEGGPDQSAYYSYAHLTALLKSHATSALGAAAFATLPTTDPSDGGEFFVSSAQEKAWGLISSVSTAIDGSIGFAVNGAGGTYYDFDPNDRGSGTLFDFIGLAEQEITHALGRVSLLTFNKGWAPLDLYRYSAKGVISHQLGVANYFSLDRGATNLGNFAQNVDPSDWAQGTGPDSLDYSAPLGVKNPYTNRDVNQLNVIGFDTAAPDDDIIGGGQSVDLANYVNNEVDLYFTTSQNPDAVFGSNGTVEIISVQTSVTGDDDYVDFIGGSGNFAYLTGTNGIWDHITGSSSTITLGNAQATVSGDDDGVYFSGSGDIVELLSTNGVRDGVFGSNGIIDLDDAQTAVTGGGNSINFTAGDTDDVLALYGTDETLDSVAGSGGTIYLVGAQTSVTGGGDSVFFAGGTGNVVSLFNTNGDGDGVAGSGGMVYLNSAQAGVTGGGDGVDFVSGTGDAVALYDTNGDGDGVAGSGGTVYLSSAQAGVNGGGDVIYFVAGTYDSVDLFGTAGVADVVQASQGTIYLSSAQADVYGSNDTLLLSGSSTVELSGSVNVVYAPKGIGGQDVVGGFGSANVISFKAQDFSDFAVLQSHMSKSGNDTLITLDASDSVRLTDVAMTSLTASQFRFL